MNMFTHSFSSAKLQLITLVALFLCSTGTAWSMSTDGLIGVSPGFPQIDATSGPGQGVIYDSASRTLTVTSTPTLYFPDSSTLNFITGGLLTIIANFNLDGNLAGGSLFISGTTSGGLSDPLLSGSLLSLGLEDTSPTPGGTDRGDFLFAPTGGSILTDPQWPLGAFIGATLTIEGSTYSGSMDTDWTGERAKLIVGPVATVGLSEPMTLPLVLLGLFGIIFSRRFIRTAIKT
jgi:hypothetical protein